MRVLIVGSGAREHALCWKIRQSPLLTDLLAAPGNPGISAIARCVNVRAADIDGLVALALAECVDLVVVGPEDPLALGLVDRLSTHGIAAFGPNAAAAALEGSKAFAKDFMSRHAIPTARYEVVNSMETALASLDSWTYPLVIKADGLARGRGVTIADSREVAEATLRRYMIDRAFGEQGETVVLEEFLEGEEISLIGLCDGDRVIALSPAEDHKQLLDGDHGPNTGGMGCFSPVPGYSTGDAARDETEILQAAVDAMKSEGRPFRGALFANLMVTAHGTRVLEFNARFGDPETEVILARMESDILPLLLACATGSLEGRQIEWRPESAVCVVLVSAGYPGSFAQGKEIDGLDSRGQIPAAAGGGLIQVFHAGTAAEDGGFVTAGGRVMAVTALGCTMDDAIEAAYQAAGRIHFEGLQRRSDIGRRHLAST